MQQSADFRWVNARTDGDSSANESGLADHLQSTPDDIATAVRAHAERIMRAAGWSLIHPSPQSHRVLSAVMDCWEEAYRSGAKFAADSLKGPKHD